MVGETVYDFARPTPAISLQRLGSAQGEIRTGEVRPVFVPLVPSRGKNADIERHILQAPREGAHEIGGCGAVRSGHADPRVPLVP